MAGMRLQAFLGVGLLMAASWAGCVTPSAALVDEGDDGQTLACPSPCTVVIDRGARWEPAVTVDPSDGSRIVAASMDQAWGEDGQRRSWPLAHVSHDGGASWATLRLPMGPDQAHDHPLVTYNHADDPMVLFLPDGTLLYTALVFTLASAQRTVLTMSSPSIALWRSTDGGRTFPDARIIQPGSGTSFPPFVPRSVGHDKQWLAAGADGTVLMAWNINQDRNVCVGACTQVLVASSTDGGRTWSEPSLVYGGVASGAFPLILDDGSWVVSYRETDAAAVHVAVSTDRGRTWTTNSTIDSTTKFPVLARTTGPGPTGERVYMAYPMSAEREGQPDVPQVVTLRWSDDGGRTWSDTLVLDSTETAARTSPALAATPDGGAIVTYWFPTGAGEDLRAELRATAIAPDGTASQRLVLDTHEGSTRTTGDYMGLVTLPDRQGAFAVWNARHGDDHVITGARLGATMESS